MYILFDIYYMYILFSNHPLPFLGHDLGSYLRFANVWINHTLYKSTLLTLVSWLRLQCNGLQLYPKEGVIRQGKCKMQKKNS